MGNLDKDVDNEELKNYFMKEFSSTLFAKVIVDRKSKITRGYGFVDFAREDDYIKALTSKQKRILKGKQLIIR